MTRASPPTMSRPTSEIIRISWLEEIVSRRRYIGYGGGQAGADGLAGMVTLSEMVLKLIGSVISSSVSSVSSGEILFGCAEKVSSAITVHPYPPQTIEYSHKRFYHIMPVKAPRFRRCCRPLLSPGCYHLRRGRHRHSCMCCQLHCQCFACSHTGRSGCPER